MLTALLELRRRVRAYTKALPGMLAEMDAAGTLAPLAVVGNPDSCGRVRLGGRITNLKAPEQVGPDPTGKLAAALDQAAAGGRAAGLRQVTVVCDLDLRDRESNRLLKRAGFRKHHVTEDSWSVQWRLTLDVGPPS